MIDLDEVYEWMGFTTKGHAKRKLETSLDENVDYIVFTRSGKTSMEEGDQLIKS